MQDLIASLDEITGNNCGVVLDDIAEDGNTIYNKTTGQVAHLGKEDGIYMMNVKVLPYGAVPQAALATKTVAPVEAVADDGAEEIGIGNEPEDETEAKQV